MSEIIKSYKKHDTEFELAREYVLALKGQGSNIHQFGSSVRLQRLLERFDLVGEQIESFVKDAAKYCFLKGMDLKKFIELVHEVSILVEKSGIDLQKLPAQIQKKEREFYMVTMDLSSKKADREQALRECYETKALLDELKRKKVQTSKELTNLQEIKALGEDTLIRFLAYYISQWSWEKTARAVLAHELAEANKSLYFVKWVLSELTNSNKKNP